MAKGGARTGAGRKAGGRNAKSAEIAVKAAEAGVTPLEFMLKIMRDEACPDGADVAQKIAFHMFRFEAAKAAAPYCHPKLGQVEHSGPGGKPIPHTVRILFGAGN